MGGLETGAWELAQGLVQSAGQQVTLIIESPRRSGWQQIRGVQVRTVQNRWRAMREDFSNSVDIAAGWKLKRFRWRLLYQFPLLCATRPWRAPDPPPLAADPRLLEITCDVWAAFGVNQDAARVVATARRQGRPSILFLESNADVSCGPASSQLQTEPQTTRQSEPDDANAYGVTAAERKFCLSQATAVVCQSHWQMHHLQVGWGRQGTLIRNPIRLAEWRSARVADQAAASYVLWIGRYDDFHKRPLLALEIARLCPQIPFRMIINAGAAQIEQQVRHGRPANVSLVDYVPYDRMPEVFSQARVMLSTSAAAHEGFPNVILQAAASGTPIVSLEDFDDFITASGAGECSGGDLAAAARLVQAAWQRGTAPDAARVAAALQEFEQPHVARQVAHLAASLHAPGQNA